VASLFPLLFRNMLALVINLDLKPCLLLLQLKLSELVNIALFSKLLITAYELSTVNRLRRTELNVEGSWLVVLIGFSHCLGEVDAA